MAGILIGAGAPPCGTILKVHLLHKAAVISKFIIFWPCILQNEIYITEQ